ncbi:uncharacterized protein Os04g0629400-like [Zingiber officinale]|uniref:uncharacterized protein Os04g0629400-like n=1 Tax=Zingiber officinale TaxID=94328 RepID=UPI001C4DC82D|nr:uncharacterized protein Os04g0629400-like [Zingiber officinale]
MNLYKMVFKANRKLRTPNLSVSAREAGADPWEEEGKMWCYVGKATKIFFFVVVVLLVVGLVLGFGLLRRTGSGSSSHVHGDCDGRSCQPALPQQVPAAASQPPLLSPPNPAAVTLPPGSV